MVAPVDSNGAVAAPRSQAESLDKIARELNLGGRPPRPSWLTTEMFVAVCDQIASGKTLRAIAKEMQFSESNFRFAVANDTRLAARVAESRQLQADSWGDEIVEISDDGSNDEKTVMRNGTEATVVNYENINRSKLRVDTRKWLMGKIAPKRYGELLTVDQNTTLHVSDSVQSLLTGLREQREAIQEAELVQPLPAIEAAPGDSTGNEIKPAGGF